MIHVFIEMLLILIQSNQIKASKPCRLHRQRSPHIWATHCLMENNSQSISTNLSCLILVISFCMTIRIVEIFGQKVGVRTKPTVQIVFSIKVSAFNFLSYYDRQWLHICSKMLQQQNVISLCFVSRAPSAKNGH